MFKNYFKIAIRNLTKQKGLSFISVFGLAVGIACFTLCTLYALNEFSFDSFHKNTANIYRVYNWQEAINGSDATGNIYLPMPLGPAMKKGLPGVKNYVRYVQPYEMFIKTGDKGARQEIGFADPSFFSVFSFKLKYGDPATALKELNSVVLTEETAKRIFGKTDIVGQSFGVKVADKFEPFTVTAIAENPPSNSSFQFDMLASLNYLATTPEGMMGMDNWKWSSYITYVQLQPGSKLPYNSRTLSDFKEKYLPGVEKDARSQGYAGKGPFSWYALEPLRSIHTDTRLRGAKIPPVDPKSIWILLSIAAGILLIACINFTTLAIGRSASRAKEVGVRKVIGGTKKSLVFQFLAESILLTFFSTIIGLLLANFLLPWFNQLSGRELIFSFVKFPQLTGIVLALVLVVGLLAGSFPSLLLSRFKPVEVLKIKVKLGGANFFTKSLVTLQFVLSAGLIISAVIIMQQLHYMQSKNPGFDKENVVVVEALGVSDTKNMYPLFKQELSANPDIVSTASAENGLGEHEGMNSTAIDYRGKSISISQFYIDPDYVPTLGMYLLAGRNFSSAVSSDTVNSIIINEAMMNELGRTLKNSIGQPLKEYTNYGMAAHPPVVIGVVKDFNYMGLQQKVQPQLFHQFASSFSKPYRFFIRLKPGDPSKALGALQRAWKKIAPGYPFKYNFLDENLNRFYKSEARLSNIIGWAGGISVFLACLGLLGLATLSAINRIKEIGIRKVLGASLSAILGLLSKDFIKLVLIAFVIATPLVWYLISKWLQDFAYRINIDWWVFATTGLAIICIALLTISFQAIKAAIANPVKSLRTE